MTRAVLPLLVLALATAPSAVASPDGAGAALPGHSAGLSLSGLLSGQGGGIDPDPDALRAGDDTGGMLSTRDRDVEQGKYELRLECWFWIASLDARTKASSGDMRLARALGNLEPFQTGIHHTDIVDEMNVPESRLIVSPEITLRLKDSALRASWWWMRETSELTPSRVYAFGDVIYAVDSTPGPDRFPPDPAPALILPRISFTAELMDTKLIYEARVSASSSLEAYVGLGIHWIRYKATAKTTDRVFEAYDDGSIHDRDPVTEEQAGDYPLLSLSMRFEYRPYANFYVSFDLQEMYLYAGNYTDLKVAVWNQPVPYVRIGAGWRIWNARLSLYELGSDEQSIELNTVLMGFWAGLFLII